jgi:HD domain
MPDIRDIVRGIDQDLSDIARSVIRRNLDLSDPVNLAFLESPDDRHQHQAQWHQWGIITHTRKFLEYYSTDVPRLLHECRVWQRTERWLSVEVDGVRKRDLLEIAILLHDVGKFAARTRGTKRFHFAGHERSSAEIIRQDLDLQDRGLHADHIEYIARTAGDHFVLALVRKRAREQGEYDMQFLRSDRFSCIVDHVKSEHPDDFVELGVLFLGDSLAKADPTGGPEAALSQYDLNVECARVYLQRVLSQDSTQ